MQESQHRHRLRTAAHRRVVVPGLVLGLAVALFGPTGRASASEGMASGPSERSTVEVVASGPTMDVAGRTARVRIERRPGFRYPVRLVERDDAVAGAEARAGTGPVGVAASGRRRLAAPAVVADHLVVTLRPGHDAEDLAPTLARCGASVRRVLPISGRVLVSFDGISDVARFDRVRAALAAASAVACAEPDIVVQVGPDAQGFEPVGSATYPDDPYFPFLWGMDNQGQGKPDGGSVTIGAGDRLEAAPMVYSRPSPGLTAEAVACGLGRPADFPGDIAGKIAVIRRGEITFVEKVGNAQAVGAVGVVLADDQEGPIPWVTLDRSGEWPVAVSVSQASGDALFASLPTSVTIVSEGSTVDADIDAPEAWGSFTGDGSVVVAVIDTGIDSTHEDLADRMWVNPDEIAGNGVDDDGNGLIDDVHGYDFHNDDPDPMDGHGHGTHCAGTIGGAGSNGIGVTGVCWDVRLMAVKGMSDSGSGLKSTLTECIAYVTMMAERGHPVRLSSNSWGTNGGGGYDPSMEAAIAAADAAGVLFVCAAGNDALDHETTPYYPGDLELDNIIVVAASDSDDQLASFSSYGAVHVDLAAPGVSILSSVTNNGYALYQGTSMATPHVAGAAALLWMANPSLGHHVVRQALLDGVDVTDGLADRVATGGRLNLAGSLALATGEVPWLRMPEVALTVVGDDGDAVLNPGEGLRLAVTVDNVGVGGGAVTGLSLSLAIGDPAAAAAVDVITGTVSVGRLEEGERQVVSGLEIAVHGDAPTPLAVPLEIRASCDQGTWTRVRGTLVEDTVPVIGVVELDGQPLAGVPVYAEGPRASVVLSESDGTYRIGASPDSAYVVWANQDTWVATPRFDVAVETARVTGPTLSFLNASVSGRVTTMRGAAIADAEISWTVSAWPGGPVLRGTIASGSDGGYEVAGVFGQPMTIDLRACKPGAYASAIAERELPPSATCDFALSSSRLAVEPGELTCRAEVGEEVELELAVINPDRGTSRWSVEVADALVADGSLPGRQVTQLPGLRPQPVVGGRGLAYDNDAGVIYAGKATWKGPWSKYYEYLDNRIQVVDAITGETLREMPIQSFLRGGDEERARILDLAWSGVDLWVLYSWHVPGGRGKTDRVSILRLDAETGALLDELSLDTGDDEPDWWYGLAWGDGYLWMMLERDASVFYWPRQAVVYKIDPRGGGILDRVQLEYPMDLWSSGIFPKASWDGEVLCVGHGGAYNRNGEYSSLPVLRYSPTTGELIDSIPLGRFHTSGVTFDAHGRVWQVGGRIVLGGRDDQGGDKMDEPTQGVMQRAVSIHTMFSHSISIFMPAGKVWMYGKMKFEGDLVVMESGRRPWLRVDQHGGSLPAGAQSIVRVTCDAGVAGAGSHTARLVLCTETSRIEVPVSFTVEPVTGNHAPTAHMDVATTRPGTSVSIPVLANDTDADGDPLQVVAVTPAVGGQVTIDGEEILYRPHAGFWGRDVFGYTVGDGTHRHVDQGEVVVMVDGAEEVLIPNGSFEDQDVADGKETQPITGWEIRRSPWSIMDNIFRFWPYHVRCRNPGEAEYSGAGDGDPTPGPFPDGRNVLSLRTGAARCRTDAVVEAGATYTLNVSAAARKNSAVDCFMGPKLYLIAGSGEDETCLGVSTNLAMTQGMWSRYALQCNVPAGEDLAGLPISVQCWTRNLGLTLTNPSEEPTDFDDFRLVKRFLPDTWPPHAQPDVAWTVRDTPIVIDVVANDRDPEGGGLILSAAGPAAVGAVAVVDGRVAYVPAAGWTGLDRFAYVVADPEGKRATGVCRVQVLGGTRRLIEARRIPSFEWELWAPPDGVALYPWQDVQRFLVPPAVEAVLRLHPLGEG